MIVAVEVSAHRDKFNCQACRWQRHCDDTNPAPIAMWIIPGVIESRTCLLPMVTEREIEMLRFYQHYKQNRLPLAGGLLDQPNNYLEAMETIAAAVANVKLDD